MAGKTPTGLQPRHSRRCRKELGADLPALREITGRPCRCKPGPAYEAWVWSRRDNGKISKRFSGPGALAAAKHWRADATMAVNRGRLRPATRKTIREAADELITGMRDGSIRSNRRRPYKPSTIRSYERALGVLPEQRERAPERLLEAFGETRLADLDRHAVQDYVERLLSAGYDPSTVHNQLDALRVIYRRARDRDEVAIDPTERLDLPRPEGKREHIASSPAEATRLLEALPPDDRALWATAFYAGLRRGELRALRWLDVDLPAREIRVRRTWDDCEGEQRDGKTAAAHRTVPITGALLAELRDHQMRSGRRGSDLVFGSEADEPFVPSTVRRCARQAWDGAKVEPITLHEGRHTCASLWIAAGVDAKAVCEWMGHATIGITFDRYGHLFDNARAEAVRRVDEFLGTEKPAALREV